MSLQGGEVTCVLRMPCISGSLGQRGYQLGSDFVCLVYFQRKAERPVLQSQGFLGTHSEARSAGKTMQDSCPTVRNGIVTFALLLSAMRDDLHLAFFFFCYITYLSIFIKCRDTWV